MRFIPSIIPCLFLAALAAPLPAQTAPAANPVLPPPSNADLQRILPLLDQSTLVVIGELSLPASLPAPNASPTPTLKPSDVLLSQVPGTFDIFGANKSSFALLLPPGTNFPVAQPSIWFIKQNPDASRSPLPAAPYLPLAEKDKVIAVAERWLDQQINAQIKALADVYKKDPDGDAPESWQAALRAFTLGQNENAFPTLSKRTTDHPSRGHLADFYKAVGNDLGIPPYINTPADLEKTIAVLKDVPNIPVADAASRAATRPGPVDADFDQNIRLFLYNRFVIIGRTLAADDERFKDRQSEYTPLLPPGTKLTRMAAFKALAASQLAPRPK